ncbi:hypothetical protein [Gordonia sp. NPDC003376]
MAPDTCAAAYRLIKKILVRYPLHRLQRGGPETTRVFYDDSWPGTDSPRVMAAHGNRIELCSGACHSLARLAPLVTPALRLAWLDDVRRMNRGLLDEGPDLARHLFGTDGSRYSDRPVSSPSSSAHMRLLRPRSAWRSPRRPCPALLTVLPCSRSCPGHGWGSMG